MCAEIMSFSFLKNLHFLMTVGRYFGPETRLDFRAKWSMEQRITALTLQSISSGAIFALGDFQRFQRRLNSLGVFLENVILTRNLT